MNRSGYKDELAKVAKAMLNCAKEKKDLKRRLTHATKVIEAAKRWLEAEDASNDRNNYPLSAKGPDYPREARAAREAFRALIGEEGE